MPKRTELKVFRVKLGLSQEKLAAEVGYTREHYRRIEQGVYEPTLRFIEAFKSRFNLTHEQAVKLLRKDGE